MKTVNMVAFELSKEEAKNLEEDTPILIYNALTDDYKLDRAGKKCIANSKYASNTLIYFALDYPKFKEKESEI